MRKETKELILKLYGKNALQQQIEYEKERVEINQKDQEIVYRDLESTGDYDTPESLI